MDILDDLEARILACLIEKKITTPDYYPMSLNSLVNACNQKSNRNPLMNLDEKTVVRALDGLRGAELAFRILSQEFRTPKYEHAFSHIHPFTPTQTAVLCELMLRGPQTVGSLRSRASRMEKMDYIQVEEALDELAQSEQGPFAMRLPRAPGQKESRWMHLLCGAPDAEQLAAMAPEEKAVAQVRAENERLDELEQALEKVMKQLEQLQDRFETFAAQFE